MSHFSVLVIGPNVEAQLAPYHEFECTGDDNQYVQDVDETEEARKEFERQTTTRYRDPEGNLHDPYTPEGNHNNMFWRELTPEEEAKYIGGKGHAFFQDWEATEEHGGLRLYSTDWHDGLPYHTKAFQWPSEGWTKVEVPESTTCTFAEFCEDYYGHTIVPFGEQPNFEPTLDAEGRKIDSNHKYGYTIVDEQGNVVKTIDRTNPNAKWDWYQVGGRWNGYFKLKPMAVGVVGAPGLQTMNHDYVPVDEDTRADILMKGDIDIEGMRDEAGQEAEERYNLVDSICHNLPTAYTWKEVQARNRKDDAVDEDGDFKNIDWNAAREEYNAQPMVKALRENRETIWYEIDDFLCTKEEYIQRARDRALSTFAVVKDGVWYQKGRMGWWAAVSDAMPQAEWNAKFTALIDSLPDDTMLTVVDCHI